MARCSDDVVTEGHFGGHDGFCYSCAC